MLNFWIPKHNNFFLLRYLSIFLPRCLLRVLLARSFSQKIIWHFFKIFIRLIELPSICNIYKRKKKIKIGNKKIKNCRKLVVPIWPFQYIRKGIKRPRHGRLPIKRRLIKIKDYWNFVAKYNIFLTSFVEWKYQLKISKYNFTYK